MKNTIIALAIVVLLLVVGWYIWGKKSPATQTTTQNTVTDQVTSSAPASQSATTVTLTDSGFSPASLTVTSGTVVTFVNQSSSPMWVASNPHPTHTDLPGFDEKQAVAKGGSYTFTFVKKGTFGYHNHLDPTADTGSITVQ